VSAPPRYRCDELGELATELLFDTADVREGHLARAERLHDELSAESDAAERYPIDYLAYRLTGQRSQPRRQALLPVEDVLPDLRQLIDQISRASPAAEPDIGEPIDTVAGLAARLSVSGKTVRRWRDQGLRWRWFVPADQRRAQVGFTASAVERFRAAHGGRVASAAGFSRIPKGEREELIREARKLAANSRRSLNRVATELADRHGRAVETVRLVLEKHDRAHPDEPLFPRHTGPLTARDKRVIARGHRMGISAARLAEHFGRSRASIYRAIHQRRAAAVRKVDLHWISSPTFDREDADEVLLHEPEALTGESPSRTDAPLEGLPEALHGLYAGQRVSDRRARFWFVRMNYLKYRAAEVRRALDPQSPRSSDLDRFDESVRLAGEQRAALVRAFLPVTLSVARRHAGVDEQSLPLLLSLLRVGHGVLGEAVDRYDATQDRGFTSVLTNRLLLRFAATQSAAEGEGRARRREPVDRLVAAVLDAADITADGRPRPARPARTAG